MLFCPEAQTDFCSLFLVVLCLICPLLPTTLSKSCLKIVLQLLHVNVHHVVVAVWGDLHLFSHESLFFALVVKLPADLLLLLLSLRILMMTLLLL